MNMQNKSFKKRAGTTDRGKDYENLYMAHLAYKLIVDESTKDFNIWSNDDDFGAFDDVILQTGDQNSIKFAIQMKLKRNKRLQPVSLQSEKGDFSIKKYFESFQTNYDVLSKYELILFTNSQFNCHNATLQLTDKEGNQDASFLVKIVEVDANPVLNTIPNNPNKPTSSSAKCFKFEIEDDPNQPTPGIVAKYKEFFNIFFLYPNQMNVEKLHVEISAQIESKFSCTHDISNKFITFFSRWNLIEGKKEKLNKIEMKRLIALYLASSNVHSLCFGKVCKNRKILQAAICKFHVTIFERKVENKIWVYDKDEFDTKEANKVNKHYQLFVNTHKISDLDCSKILFLMGQCPLIVNETSTVLEAIKLCNDRSFVVLTDNLSTDLNNFSVFRNLSDLKCCNLLTDVLSNFKCTVSGREIDLVRIVQTLDMKTITTNELLLMVDSPYKITQEMEKLSVPYISRQLSRNIIDVKFLSKIDNETLVLISNVKTKDEKNYFEEYGCVDIQNYLGNSKNKKLGEQVILISQEVCATESFEKICSRTKKQSYHHFKYCEGLLEWVKSVGDFSTLRSSVLQNYSVEENELYQSNLGTKVHIIVGDPGLGKSLLLKSLKNNFSTKTIATIFTPNDIKNLCSFWNRNKKDLDKLQNYILQLKHSLYFDQCVVASLTRKGEVIYLWDALEEITNNDDRNTITEIIEKFSEKGIEQWITCRKHLRDALENKFGVLSQTLLEFNEQQQTEYIQKRLESVCSSKNALDQLTKKFMTNVSLFKHADILSIPLQIYMLTEICRESNDISNLMKGVVSLAQLYEYFVDEKFKFCYKKFVPNSDDTYTDKLKEEKYFFIKRCEKIALKTILEDEILKELKIDTEEIDEDMQRFTDRYGFIIEVTVINSKTFIKFAHVSYAEYFVASYFERRKKSNIKRFIFEEKYRNVRYFAVLCNNLTELKKHENEINMKDSLGRNPLQVACSWGGRWKTLNVTKKDENFHLDVSHGSLQENPTEYLELVDFLLDNCQIHERDNTFNMNAIEYSEKSNSIFALAAIEEKDEVKYFGSEHFVIMTTVLYYAVQFNLLRFISLFEPYLNRITIGFLNQNLCHFACQYGNEELVQKLINCGVNTNASNKDGNTPLCLACKAGKDDLVKLLINSVNVNVCNKDGDTSLILACKKGNEEIVKLLIEFHADINAFNKEGCTALTYACKMGKNKIVDLLLTAEADINATTKDGETYLFLACKNGNEKLVRLFINKGLDVNTSSANGNTPLILVCKIGNEKLVDLLINEGSDVNAFNKKGYTSLVYAYTTGNNNIVERLRKVNADINAFDKFGNTSLISACKNNDNKVVKLLTNAGANITATNNDEYTPLIFACKNGNEEIVRLLLQNESKVNASSKDKSTPLIFACHNGNKNIVSLLINARAELEATNKDGYTPLMSACKKGNEEVAELLINAGVNVNSSNKDGYTPLLSACKNGNEKLVKMLIRAEANVNAPNIDGYTPLISACKIGHEKVVALLIQKGVDINASNKNGYTALISACRNGDIKIVRMLLQAGANVNSSNNSGFTPLISACTIGNEKIVKMLIEAKADVNVSNKDGYTPLLSACYRGDKKVVEDLLNANADVNAVNKKGETSLIFACTKNNEEIVKLLLKTSVDVNAANKYNITPLMIARRNGNEEIANLLINRGAYLLDESYYQPHV